MFENTSEEGDVGKRRGNQVGRVDGVNRPSCLSTHTSWPWRLGELSADTYSQDRLLCVSFLPTTIED